MSSGDNDHVEPIFACPNCGESDIDRLVWQQPPNEDQVQCQSCGRMYLPGGGDHGE